MYEVRNKGGGGGGGGLRCTYHVYIYIFKKY